MGVLKQCLRDEVLTTSPPMQESNGSGKNTGKAGTSSQADTHVGDTDKSSKPVSSHRMAMNTIFR